MELANIDDTLISAQIIQAQPRERLTFGSSSQSLNQSKVYCNMLANRLDLKTRTDGDGWL